MMRALLKHTPNYLDQLWMLASDRRHANGATAQMAELKADWCRVQKLLGTVPETTCDFYPNNPNNPEKTGIIIRQKMAESSG